MKNQAKEPENIYATVDELIKILQTVSNKGKEDYTVDCNSEYCLARKDEVPVVSDKLKSVSISGYL